MSPIPAEPLESPTLTECDSDAGCPATSPVRRRDKAATKQALLEAAMQVFAARGFDAATTREVAARAGANEQLIQRYFGGKAGLLLAILERFGSVEQGCPGTLPPPQDTVEGEIIAFLSFHLDHGRTCGDFMKVALYRAIVDPAVAAEISRTVAAARVPCLRQRLEALRANGAIDPAADLDAVATGLSSLSFSLGFIEQVVFGMAPERAAAIARNMAAIIAAGLAPKAAPSAAAGREPPRSSRP
jgi:AcrR family transcriptional regulator